MPARKSSHGTIFLIVSSGSPLALIASSLRSTSKKPFCPMTRSLHPPMTACGHRVRFARTWREGFFEVPLDQWYAESIIFGSGRPIVILPYERKRSGSFALDTVIVAWDFSRPATRAMADAIPILEKAKRVCVLTVTKEKAIDTRRSGAELAKHLARHGADVVLDEVDAKGRSIGDVFEAHVTYRNADLLVMGAYGHSRLREFVLGGATKSMLARPPVPVFLSH